MMRKIAYFDLDGSLANFDLVMYTQLLKKFGDRAKQLDHVYDSEDKPADITAEIRRVKGIKNWWLNLPRIEAGFVIVNLCKEMGYEIHIASRGPSHYPQAWAEKLMWCQKQPELKDSPVHIVSEKSILMGDILYDDNAKYMNQWLAGNPSGVGIMLAKPENSTYKNQKVVRYNGANLKEVKELLNVLELLKESS